MKRKLIIEINAGTAINLLSALSALPKLLRAKSTKISEPEFEAKVKQRQNWTIEISYENRDSTQPGKQLNILEETNYPINHR